jgi:hypothetical protein
MILTQRGLNNGKIQKLKDEWGTWNGNTWNRGKNEYDMKWISHEDIEVYERKTREEESRFLPYRYGE